MCTCKAETVKLENALTTAASCQQQQRSTCSAIFNSDLLPNCSHTRPMCVCVCVRACARARVWDSVCVRVFGINNNIPTYHDQCWQTSPQGLYQQSYNSKSQRKYYYKQSLGLLIREAAKRAALPRTSNESEICLSLRCKVLAMQRKLVWKRGEVALPRKRNIPGSF